MTSMFTEAEVHAHIYSVGLEKLIVDEDLLPHEAGLLDETEDLDSEDEKAPFELWRLVKRRAIDKLTKINSLVRYGDFIGSKVKLPTDSSTPMELDLLGRHEDGLFVLELKVAKSAERQAFSELFAYSGYLAEMFALSGNKDITNVLVARVDAKITRQAFLYDLIVNDRQIVIYRPEFSGSYIHTLRLSLFLPSDEDFRYFTNNLLSHEVMSCVVVSFEDLEGWFDSKESNGSLNSYTKDHLTKLSAYAAQLMESERLNGFCFARKPWREIPLYYRNSLIICAANPFRNVDPEREKIITDQISLEHANSFIESAEMGFDGRLLSIAERALQACLPLDTDHEFETPYWGAMVTNLQEVVFTHNFAFRPVGLLREAYVDYLGEIYARNVDSEFPEDVSVVPANEIFNWLRAWEFMRMCGFGYPGDSDEGQEH